MPVKLLLIFGIIQLTSGILISMPPVGRCRRIKEC